MVMVLGEPYYFLKHVKSVLDPKAQETYSGKKNLKG